MSSVDTTQEARLFSAGGDIQVGTTQVPAFPNNPKLIKLPDGRYFLADDPAIGYGVNWLSYSLVGPYLVGE